MYCKLVVYPCGLWRCSISTAQSRRNLYRSLLPSSAADSVDNIAGSLGPPCDHLKRPQRKCIWSYQWISCSIDQYFFYFPLHVAAVIPLQCSNGHTFTNDWPATKASNRNNKLKFFGPEWSGGTQLIRWREHVHEMVGGLLKSSWSVSIRWNMRGPGVNWPVKVFFPVDLVTLVVGWNPLWLWWIDGFILLHIPVNASLMWPKSGEGKTFRWLWWTCLWSSSITNFEGQIAWSRFYNFMGLQQHCFVFRGRRKEAQVKSLQF